jgi:hypothetical protein
MFATSFIDHEAPDATGPHPEFEATADRIHCMNCASKTPISPKRFFGWAWQELFS